MGELSIDY